MGFFDQFINAMIGACGIKRRFKKFDQTHNASFVPALTPGAVIVTWDTKATFIGGGIQGACDGIAAHVIGYPGQCGGDLVRRAYPVLMTRRINPIPREVKPDEIVEATRPKVRIGSLSEYLNDSKQMIAFCFPDLFQRELEKILGYVYSKVGTDYDWQELFSDAFPLFGFHHPEAKNVCASLWSVGYGMAGRLIVKPGVNPISSTPKDIYAALYRRTEIPIATWNWNPFDPSSLPRCYLVNSLLSQF